MKTYKLLIVVALFLIGAGLAVIAPLGFSWMQEREALAAPANGTQPLITTPSQPIATKPDIIQGTPVRITVPSLGIDASVENGYYDSKSGQWTLSEDSAFYATPTSPINSDTGNTLIYGHNSQKIFGKLLKIQSGAEVMVTTDNGYVFTYLFDSTEAVKPTDTHPLIYSGKPRLTLQTCSGIWHENRQMFYFFLKEYHKA